MIAKESAEEVVGKLRQTRTAGVELRRSAMEALSELPGYSWSGVYRLEGDTLILDEFVGAPTDHTRIGVGTGVCGTAVAENRNQVIDDVRDIENYLSCSVSTRSEIVVLIRRNGEILGQIDVDGHEVAAFDRSDEAFLNQVAEILAERW